MRYCPCGAPIERKVYDSGKRESPLHWANRKHCTRECSFRYKHYVLPKREMLLAAPLRDFIRKRLYSGPASMSIRDASRQYAERHGISEEKAFNRVRKLAVGEHDRVTVQFADELLCAFDTPLAAVYSI